MKWHKRILKSRLIHRLFVWLLAHYIRFCYLTARKQYIFHPESAPFMRGEENGIFAFWHGRLMMIPPLCPPKRRMHVLISQHRDGVLISDVMSEFGFSTIAGSSSKNGRAALMSMLKMLKSGDNVAFTPDGPRGPAQVAAAGIITTAKLSGKPIIPINFYAAWHKRFASWDRFMLALPFSKMIFCADAPIVIKRDAEDEAARLVVESIMNRQIEQTDAALL